MSEDKATGNKEPPAPTEDDEAKLLRKGSVQLVPQSTAIEKTPAVCTAAAKWKSKLSSSQVELPVTADQLGPLGEADENSLPLPPNTPDMKGEVVKDEGFPLVELSSPGHQPNGSAAHHGEANKMIRPSISITEAPQVGRPSSRISGRASASSLSMLATESGKLLQAVPLATGGPSGEQQDGHVALVTLRLNNHSLLAAIPYMPVGLAYVCLLLNVFLPGFGTLIAGFSLFCCKAEPQPHTKKDEIINSFCTNVCVAVSQLFTIPFLLVGWIWSVTWGVFMVTFALEYRDYKKNEKMISTAKAVTKAFMGR